MSNMGGGGLFVSFVGPAEQVWFFSISLVSLFMFLFFFSDEVHLSGNLGNQWL